MNSTTMVTALMMNRSADGERAPQLPEPGIDQLAVPHPGDRPEAHYHFLAEEQDREKENQAPEQLHAVVLAHCR